MTGSTHRRDSLLMIAARSPIAGETKTRLGHAIGMQSAADLYRAFLRDIADRFDSEEWARGRAYDLAWTHSPPERNFASDLAGATGRRSPASTLFVPQDGLDWGTRQTNLLRWAAAQGYAQTVLMASDSPQLETTVIDQAFACLDAHDVVLGRVRDGGYYLVGMVGFHDVLSGVPMSTISAADGVVEAALARGLSVGETDPTFDVDVVNDVVYLVDLLRENPERCPATHAALVELGLAGCSSNP
jgi:glycosyltransferase A (GT-A) superfamily protein (DUF2064 family)